MDRKLWIPLLFLVMIALLAAGAVVARPRSGAAASGLPAPDPSAARQISTFGTYYWSYAVKYVCGYQRFDTPAGTQLQGEPVVKPGNYATDINIHNPNFRVVPLIKRIIVLADGDAVIHEPAAAAPAAGMTMELKANNATLDDCNLLWLKAHPTATVVPTPMPLFIGYLVILSPLDLNVNAVYTANAPGVTGQAPTGISIDVQPVSGKRVFLPTTVNP